MPDCVVCTEKLKLNQKPPNVKAVLSNDEQKLLTFIRELCSQAQICQQCYVTFKSGQNAQTLLNFYLSLKAEKSQLVPLVELFCPELASDEPLKISTTSLDVIVATIIQILHSYVLPIKDAISASVERYISLRPQRDEFLAKNYAVQGLLLSMKLSESRNEELDAGTEENIEDHLSRIVDGTQVAVSSIIQALRIAKESGFSSLVYNASLCLWQVIGPFMTTKHKEMFLPPLINTSNTLEELDDHDYEWRIFLLLEIARASENIDSANDRTKNKDSRLNSIMQSEQAFIALKKAAKIAREHVPDQSIQILRMHVRLVRDDPRLTFSLQEDLKHEPFMIAVMNLELLRAKKGSPEVLTRNLSEIRDKILNLATTSSSNNLEESDMGMFVSESVKAQVLIRTAEIAANFSLVDFAEATLGFVQSTSEPKVFVGMRYLKARILAVRNEAFEPHQTLNQKTLQVRLTALRLTQEGISVALKNNLSGDVELGCTMLWNFLLPFFGGNFKADIMSAITNLLTFSAQSLAAINSHMRLLRCQIHGELAKICEKSHLYSKADQHIRAALRLVPKENAYLITEQFKPLLLRLEVKLDPYEGHRSKPEEEALLLAEQASLADRKIAAPLLEKALREIIPNFAFHNITDEESSFSFAWSDELKNDELRRRQYFNTIVDIVISARRYRKWDIAFTAASYLVNQPWDIQDKIPILFRKFEAYLIRGTALMELNNSITEDQPPAVAGEQEGLPLKHRLVVDSYLKGLAIAQEFPNEHAKKDLIYNAVAHIYNYYALAMYDTKINCWAPIFQQCYDAFPKPVPKDRGDLFVNLCNVLATSIIELQEQALSGLSVEEREKTIKKQITRPVVKGKMQPLDLKLADDACKAGIECLNDTIDIKVSLLNSWGVLQELRGSIVNVYDKNENIKIFSLIQYLLRTPRKQGKDYMAKILLAQKLLKNSIISEKSKLEEWVQLAKVTYDIQNYALTKEYCTNAINCAKEIRQSMKEDDATFMLLNWEGFAFLYTAQAEIAQSEVLTGMDSVNLRVSAATHLTECVHLWSQQDRVPIDEIVSILKDLYNLVLTTKMAKGAFVEQLENCSEIIFKVYTDANGQISSDNPAIEIGFATAFLELTLQSQYETQRWAKGLRIAEKSLSLFPSDRHSFLWQVKVIFLTKTGTGKAAIVSILNSVNESPEIKAKIWFTLASSYNDVKQKKMAYESAIECLSEPSLFKAEYLLNYGSWLYFNDSVTEGKRLLDNAYDLVIETVKLRSTEGQNLFEVLTAKENEVMIRISLFASLTQSTPDSRLNYLKRSLKHVNSLLDNTYRSSFRPKTMERRDTAAKISPAKKGATKEESSSVDNSAEAWPSSLEAWATFDWSPAMKKFIASGTNSQCISKSNLAGPYSLMILLDYLQQSLVDDNMHLNALPVFSLMEIIGSEIIESAEVTSLSQIPKIAVFHALNLHEQALVRKQVVDALYLLTTKCSTLASLNEDSKTKLRNLICVLTVRRISLLVQYKEYLEIEKESSKIFASTEDPKLRAQTLNYLADASTWIGHNHKAIVHCVESLLTHKDIASWVKSIGLIAQNIVNLKDVNFGIRFIDAARHHFESFVAAERTALDARLGDSQLLEQKARLQFLNDIKVDEIQSNEDELPYEKTLAKAASILEQLNDYPSLMKTFMLHISFLVEHGNTKSNMYRRNLLKQKVLIEKVLALSSSVNVESSSVSPDSRVVQPTDFTILQAKLLLARAIVDVNLYDINHPKIVKVPVTIEEKVAAFLEPPEKPDKYAESWQTTKSQLETVPQICEEVQGTVSLLPQMRSKWLSIQRDYYYLKYLNEEQSQPAVDPEGDASQVPASSSFSKQRFIQLSIDTIMDSFEELDTEAIKSSLALLLEKGDVLSSPTAFTWVSLLQMSESRSNLLNHHTASCDTNSKDSLMLRQMKDLEKKVPVSLDTMVAAKRTALYFANNVLAWKSTSFSSDFFKLPELLPKNYKVVLLQHSLDKKTLYVGYIGKKADMTSAKPVKGKKEDADVDIQVKAFPVNFQKCDDALASFVALARAIHEKAIEFSKNSQNDLFDSLLESLKVNLREVLDDEKVDDLKMQLLKFGHLFHDYLRPAIDFIQSFVLKEEAPEVDEKASKSKTTKKEDTKRDKAHYVFLLDSQLMQLPIESFMTFSDALSVSRDFNLSFLMKRLLSLSKTTAPATGKKKADEKHDIPESFAVSLNLVDPDDIQKTGAICTADVNPVNVLTAGKQSKEQLTKWTGYTGNIRHLNQNALQELFANPIFLFYGLNSMFNHIPASMVTKLDLSACQVMVLLDNVHLEEGAKRDMLESSYEKAALLSLQGAQSVVINQHSSSLSRNKKLFQKLFVDSNSKFTAEVLVAETPSQQLTLSWKDMNTIVYGVPNLLLN